jgi:UDP-glucose 4-epimerase
VAAGRPTPHDVGEPSSSEIELPQHHLILGGNSFIGRHVALLLARAGHRVTIASRTRLAFDFPADVASCILRKELELASGEWDDLVIGVDVVHHYAWSSTPASANANPTRDLLTNVTGTLGLLDSLKRRGGGRVVFASSGGTVYGKLKSAPVSEDALLAPITAYGAGKATAEIYLKLYRAMHDLDCRIARIANPYGAGQNLGRGVGAVTTFLNHALTGQPIVIWGDGETIRDFIHISDVASCLVRLACAPQSDEDFLFNVGTGVGTSLNEIVTHLEASLGRCIHVTRLPNRSFDVPISVLAIERVRQALGWSPRISFSEGIARTVADLKADSAFSRLDEPVRPRLKVQKHCVVEQRGEFPWIWAT